MTDTFFKNPNREKNGLQNKHKHASSTPEYERLGAPIVGDPKIRDVGHGLKVAQMPVDIMKGLVTGKMPIQPLAQTKSAQHQLKEQPVSYAANPNYTDRMIPQEPRTTRHQEQHPIKQAIRDVRSISEFYHTEGSDDLDVAPEIDPNATEESLTALSHITEGYYVLFYNNEIIQIGAAEVIEEAIETLVVENKVNFQDLVVMKKIAIKTGVTLSEI